MSFEWPEKWDIPEPDLLMVIELGEPEPEEEPVKHRKPKVSWRCAQCPRVGTNKSLRDAEAELRVHFHDDGCTHGIVIDRRRHAAGVITSVRRED